MRPPIPGRSITGPWPQRKPKPSDPRLSRSRAASPADGETFCTTSAQFTVDITASPSAALTKSARPPSADRRAVRMHQAPRSGSRLAPRIVSSLGDQLIGEAASSELLEIGMKPRSADSASASALTDGLSKEVRTLSGTWMGTKALAGKR